MRCKTSYSLAAAGISLLSSTQLAAGDVIKIEIGDQAFSPASVSAKPGDTIVWINNDFLDHTATADTGDFDVLVAPSQSKDVEIKSRGLVTYYCRYHPNMTGAIDVK